MSELVIVALLVVFLVRTCFSVAARRRRGADLGTGSLSQWTPAQIARESANVDRDRTSAPPDASGRPVGYGQADPLSHDSANR